MTVQGLVFFPTRYRFRFRRVLALGLLLLFVILVWFKLSDSGPPVQTIKPRNNITNNDAQDDLTGILYVDYNIKMGLPLKSGILKTAKQLKYLSGAHMCPACYSNNYCSALNSIQSEDLLKVLSLPLNNSGERYKPIVWIDTDNMSKIQISRVNNKEWSRLDSFVCRNSSLPPTCKPSIKDFRKVLGNPALVKIGNIANLYKAIDKMKNEIPLLLCATEKLVDDLKKSFDLDNNGVFNADEQSIMFTSILTNQPYVLMKFRKRTNINISIPKLLGSCGRFVFREKDWTPLTNVLEEPFEVRAGIALQILQTVEDLQDEDPDWYFFNTDFTYDSLMRTKEGDVVLVNLEDIAVVDKSLFPPYKVRPLLDPDGELCNELCFQRFTRQILDKNASLSLKTCSKVSYYGQLMQALVCKQLFSNLEEHKSPGFFNFDGNKIHKESQFPGLLHSIPEKDRETIEDLLRECVQETNIGGRKQAVDELREILERYLNYDDQEEKVSNGNEDDDDNVGV